MNNQGKSREELIDELQKMQQKYNSIAERYENDTYKRKQTEQALRKSEIKFRALFEQAGGYCMLLDPNTKDGMPIILDANIAACENHGYSREEFIGKPVGDIDDEDGKILTKERTAIIMKGEPFYVENIHVRKDGTFFPVAVNAKRIDIENELPLILTTEYNITEQKKAEQELIKAKEKAEGSDRLKSAFLANMSHEIRTPMNGILGFADLLKEPNLTGEKQLKYIGIIEKSGQRMLNIINDIISISKIEAGLMEVNIQESNINDQIEYIYTFFKPEIEAKGMQFSFRNSLPSKEAILKTDREKVYAILTNLVKNAIKFTPEGSIELGYVETDGLGHAETDGRLSLRAIQFYVKDTGIGIPKDRQKAIFDRFIQADIEDKMARQGAGLGLSISRAYVQMLGGKIWVESEEGLGSTFYFTLPYTSEKTKEKNAKNKDLTPAEVAPVKKLKILIAEDDETSEMLISIAVQKFGKEIISARTGTKAVAVCQNNPDINLVLMDIEMPKMDGYEATRQIRKFNKDVIIIAQTAYALEGEREKAIAAGCDDYIAKPYRADELEQMIIKYLKKK